MASISLHMLSVLILNLMLLSWPSCSTLLYVSFTIIEAVHLFKWLLEIKFTPLDIVFWFLLDIFHFDPFLLATSKENHENYVLTINYFAIKAYFSRFYHLPLSVNMFTNLVFLIFISKVNKFTSHTCALWYIEVYFHLRIPKTAMFILIFILSSYVHV